jgi:DNA gyrase subunit B
MQKKYSADDIQVLKGLDAVRKRPGMYIGSTGPRGLHHLLWEIVDNAMDEAANGFADKVSVTIHKDNSVTVEDNGRGIPVGIHKDLKISGVEVVFTQLHAGGKFNNENYEYSGGLHGVGASVVNALSTYLKVDVYTGGKQYHQTFKSFKDTKGKVQSGRPQGKLAEVGAARKKGTCVTYLPDTNVFETIALSFDKVAKRLRELAFLTKDVKIVLTDERVRENGKFKQKVYNFQGGIVDFVKYLNKDKTSIHETPILIEGKRDGIEIKVAMQFNDGYNEGVFSFVNNIPTPEGGTHETGFKTAVTKVMNDYARQTGVLKEKSANLTGEDYREGLCAVISLKLKNVQFEGQTKTKLGNTEARTAVDATVSEQLASFLADLNNAKLTGKLMDKAQTAAKVRDAARKAKKLERQKNKLEGAPLVGKLSSCTGRKAAENELFIVEGDSAGGSAKQGRDRRFQAILPLRGKPLNVEKKRIDQVMNNEEFRSIITALGAGFDSNYEQKSLKYHKVIILSDADQDGAHIRAILLTFFFRYYRELINNGHVYIGMPPLYKVYRAKKSIYCYTEEEMKKAIDVIGRGYKIQRYKGLGEMNPEQLWATTMSPEKRALMQVNIEDAAEAESIVSVLMGDNAESRKEYIATNVNFDKRGENEDMEAMINERQ